MIQLPIFRRTLIAIFIVCMMIVSFGCADLHKKSTLLSGKPAKTDDAKLYALEMSNTPDSIEQGQQADSTDAFSGSEENPADLNPQGTPENDSASIEIQNHLDEALDYYQASQDFWQQGETDSALQALDQAYTLILEVDTLDLPKFNQQKDDLRFMISKRILEIYASRHTTAKGNHKAIPMVINAEVQKEIDALTSEEGRAFFENAYKRSGKYRPYILSELKKAGLPEELSWLPLIESGFKVKAMSSSRALGLWQFIASTGHKFGLKRTQYVDERLDPYKSTQAAIEYLKELHEIFGDWPTVLAAYNCGEGKVLSTIRDQNVNYLDDFWDLYKRLPSETARYVPKFLATVQIANNMKKYGMDDIAVDEPAEFETLTISKQTCLEDIAGAIQVEEKCLADLNPELRYKMLPPDDYALKVPVDRKDMLLARINDIPCRTQQQYAKNLSPMPPQITYHQVRRGETLSSIANRYNINLTEITRYNNIHRTDNIAVGKFLKIPHSGAITTAFTGTTINRSNADNSSNNNKENMITYHVQQGDSLYTLAKRYNTTAKKIQRLNNLSRARLTSGQSLKIPSNQPIQNDLKIYKVKNGDSVAEIASNHKMDLDHLLSLNNLKRGSTIYPGQRLYVK